MTHFSDEYAPTRAAPRPPLWGLPDPDTQGEFYADVAVKRAVAWIMDTILVSVLTGLVAIFTVGIGLFFLPVIFLVIGFLYRVITIASKSATWGMRLASIEFRTHRGERFTTGLAFVHTLAFYVSMSFVFPQIISVILMMTGARAQGLSDMVLGTTAINRDASA